MDGTREEGELLDESTTLNDVGNELVSPRERRWSTGNSTVIRVGGIGLKSKAVWRIEDYGKFAENHLGMSGQSMAGRRRFFVKRLVRALLIYLVWACVFVGLVFVFYCLDFLLCRSDFDMG